VTAKRRSHVAVLFPNDDALRMRVALEELLDEVATYLGEKPREFHFADIYNKRGVWAKLEGPQNLGLFELFAELYGTHRWPVLIQTVDDYTVSDHPEIVALPQVDGLDPGDRQDLSLLFLALQIKVKFREVKPKLTLIVDEGIRPAGESFGTAFFRDWPYYEGYFASSAEEGLLQIADFVAFVINRSTHIALKEKRTDTDLWLLDLVYRMNIDSDQLTRSTMRSDFSVGDFDEFMRQIRKKKGL